MPKGRTPRRGRRRGRRPAAPPVAPQAARAVAAPVAVTPPGETDSPRQRTAGRAITRDYSYVRRDLRRIILLSVIILTTIVVLSFFLP
ncbi:MAG: hypothetical protein IH866_04765 [Chloroflexi bacterium]|nr:hypothetical protein [Chloroflexota bacterium]